MTDRALVRVATAVLFVLGAWPLLLCDVPPLEDLPAHLATAVVIRHPEAYPGFVFHGFFKTNATLFAWLHAFPDARLALAGKLFVALVVLAHAWAIPRLVLEIGGRARVPAATLLAAPLVHNWFVAMGMLDYALASALALACVTLLAAQRRESSRVRAVAIGALGLALWYTHVFALALVVMLVAIEAVRARSVRALVPASPLVPAISLAAWSVLIELGHPRSSGAVVYRPPWETAYELWAKYAWSFSKLEAASLVTTLVLAWCLVRERRAPAAFLSGLAALALLALHFAVPSEAFDWFAVNSRVLPFLYAAALVRAPEKLPRWAMGALAAAALATSIGLGVDYARLDRDMRELAAGTAAIPDRADLFPLVFEPKGSSENTWALLDAWGLYVVAKQTSAPLLYAHSPSFPIGYRTPPPEDEHPLRIEHEVEASIHDASAAEDLSRVASRHAWVLVWGAPPPGFRPANHAVAFRSGRLVIFGPP